MSWIHQFSSVLTFVSHLFPTGLQPDNEDLYEMSNSTTSATFSLQLKKQMYTFYLSLKMFTCSAQPSVLHLV